MTPYHCSDKLGRNPGQHIQSESIEIRLVQTAPDYYFRFAAATVEIEQTSIKQCDSIEQLSVQRRNRAELLFMVCCRSGGKS